MPHRQPATAQHFIVNKLVPKAPSVKQVLRLRLGKASEFASKMVLRLQAAGPNWDRRSEEPLLYWPLRFGTRADAFCHPSMLWHLEVDMEGLED